jgi:hypothetical protein
MANDTQVASYSNDPTNQPIDLFRLRVGDTDCRDARLTDAEIRYFLADQPSALRAAADGARAIAAKMASKVDFRHGAISKTASQLVTHFNDLADRLDHEADVAGVTPEVLGRTIAEKQAADADTGAVQPDFRKGVHDNPRSGPIPQNDTADAG